MISLGNAESIVGLMTIILAYFFVVTLAGYFRAWVAVKMGDETPEYMGFLRLNPLKHMDLVGFIFLIIFGFGWGKYIPIVPFNISGKYKKLKLFIASFADVFANLFIATISLVALVLYFGRYILNIALPMMLLQKEGGLFSLIRSINMVKANLLILYPSSSSFAISMVLITIAIMYLSVLLSVLNAIINCLSFLSVRFKDKVYFLGRYEGLFVILIAVILMSFLIGPLRYYVAYGITYFVTMLVKLIGFY